MKSFFSSVGRLRRWGRWPLALLALVVALGISGCKSWDWDGGRGEGFPDDDMSASVRDARSVEAGNGGGDEASWFVTEKGRQIDRDLRRQ
ncbi:MAG: hypothetical protein JW959_11875 [Pirellulales bacterium]|nr:hypothetical protein [Pirellulales bacterium]